MALTVLSPYSGKPVSVRPQDAGRALRDEAGRVFYVLPASRGGYYGSTTRTGGRAEEERYRQWDSRSPESAPAADAPAPAAPKPGRRRLWLMVMIVALATLGLLAACLWFAPRK